MLLQWHKVGEKTYETGVDRGVLYMPDAQGVFNTGVAWNGLVSVSENPTGAEATPQYADNVKYLNLVSIEEFEASIEAFTYPEEFAQFDGSAVPVEGVYIGQQHRGYFGLCYRSLVGNDVDGTDYGYKLHMIYNALAAPTEKAYGTVNETPEAITFSWDVTTTAVPVPGLRPAASIVVDSTKVLPADLADLEEILYGTESPEVQPRLPWPAEIISIFGGTVPTP